MCACAWCGQRCELKLSATQDEEVHVLSEKGLKDQKLFKTEEGLDKEVVEKIELVEWLSTNYKEYGCKLEFVSNKSQEGSQFCKGFGGMGGFLRYRCDFLDEDPFAGAFITTLVSEGRTKGAGHIVGNRVHLDPAHARAHTHTQNTRQCTRSTHTVSTLTLRAGLDNDGSPVPSSDSDYDDDIDIDDFM